MEFDIPRQNPDDLLRKIKQDEADESRTAGRLKIFFGYAAGVGKTYAMLLAAHDAAAKGFDVAVGYVEPHQRPATSALLEGLEVLPPLALEHRGISLREFDLDAALARRPQIMVVDELAHTNADECRHRKRYQDVEELLRAGINVYTTVNVQHLESLNDKVSSITHILVRERVPDRIFDEASSVELIDIEPEDLMERLHAGKVYGSHQAQSALSHFFTKKNLAALREIALRRTADRLTRNPRAAGLDAGEAAPDAGEDVIAYVSGSPSDARVVRTAAAMAQAAHGNAVVLVVEPPQGALPAPKKGALPAWEDVADLAESVGATVVTVCGDDPARQVALYAPAAGIGRVVVASSDGQARMLRSRESMAERIAQLAPNLVITVVPGKEATKRMVRRARQPLLGFSARDLGLALCSQALASAVCFAVHAVGLGLSAAPMVFLLMTIAGARFAQTVTYSLSAALLGTFAYNYFFTFPRFTLMANGPSYPLTFACLALGGFAISLVALNMRNQNAKTSLRAYRTEVLVDTSRRLRDAKTSDECLGIAAKQAVKLLGCRVAVFPVAEEGALGPARVMDATGTEAPAPDFGGGFPDQRERAVAQWVAANDERAGATTSTLVDAACLHLPVHGKERVYGVCAVEVGAQGGAGPFERNLLAAVLEETGQTMERIRLFQESQAMKVRAETEALRSNLLRSVSHDLRTPLTSISGSADVLIESEGQLDFGQRRALYEGIREDSLWLANLVENLLAVTRAQEGRLDLRMQPEVVSDVVEEAVRHCERHTQGRLLEVEQADDLLLASMDAALVVQVLVNLVNNAVNYTPPDSVIRVRAARLGDFARIAVTDNGPGIDESEKGHVFELFYNGTHERGDKRRGMGLGLPLCKSIVEAHGGRIGVRNVKPHGFECWFTLPCVDGFGQGPSAVNDLRSHV